MEKIFNNIETTIKITTELSDNHEQQMIITDNRNTKIKVNVVSYDQIMAELEKYLETIRKD